MTSILFNIRLRSYLISFHNIENQRRPWAEAVAMRWELITKSGSMQHGLTIEEWKFDWGESS